MNIQKLIRDIKNFKIQGSSSIALESIKFLKKVKDDKKFSKYIEILKKVRPTEPMLRNLLTYVKLTKDFTFAEEYITKSYEKISKIGARKIIKNKTYLTHCHSKTVMNIFKEARNKKNFKVFFTESRPNYQGRLTAKDLSKIGVDATMIVDSAVSVIIKNIDSVFVGCDAITAEGNLINKIGTRQIAMISNLHNTPFYSASHLLKFEPKTIMGFFEEIEYRKEDEVWDKAPRGIKIFNPIFDETQKKYVTSYITEKGIISPENIINYVYGWVINETI